MSVQFLTAWLWWWYEEFYQVYLFDVRSMLHDILCKMSKFKFFDHLLCHHFYEEKQNTFYATNFWFFFLHGSGLIPESGLICFGSHRDLGNKSFRTSSMGSLMPCHFTHWELAWILSFDPVKQPFPCLMQKISGLQKIENNFTLVFNRVHKDFEMQSEDNIYL